MTALVLCGLQVLSAAELYSELQLELPTTGTSTPATTATPTDGGSELTPAELAIIVVSSLFVIGVVIFIIYCLCQGKLQQWRQRRQQGQGQQQALPGRFLLWYQY